MRDYLNTPAKALLISFGDYASCSNDFKLGMKAALAGLMPRDNPTPRDAAPHWEWLKGFGFALALLEDFTSEELYDITRSSQDVPLGLTGQEANGLNEDFA